VIVGFYSPLPPARTGVADYSAALLRALQARWTVRANRDGDINLYHLGNNQLHADIYRRALARPGVVVLHDAVLHHFLLGSLTREQYVDEFTYNYGEWSRGLAESLWRDRARSAGDRRFFQYPMLKRIVERSEAIVVHNPAAARMVMDHCPDAQIFEIPHLFEPVNLPHAADAERFRAELQTRGALFGVFGHLRESKRVMSILRVFRRLPDCTLLLAGEIGSPDLRRAVSEYLSAPNVRRIGFMPPDMYWTAALAVDGCINLRYPAAGETSGISVGFMGVGKPVFMTDSIENSRYPEGTCIRISAGLSESDELEQVIRCTAARRGSLRDVGANASAYIREVHSIERIAELYGRALRLH
jgi:glycosyltransferase involved in cell wall biosynthesis